MNLYVIYESPSDYPGKFVLRRWVVSPATVAPEREPMLVVDDIDEAREALPRGVCLVGPQQDDDPVIYEVWV